jgi:DNA-binding MarR family transcriptional regulator
MNHPTTGYLLWRVTTKWRAAVDRAVAPLGLTHAQYSLLASLYGLSRGGLFPSQRELADFTGLEPIYVSKLARAVEQSGLVTRDEHPTDPRAVQLRLTDKGATTIRAAIDIVARLHEELTAPIGGTGGRRNADLAETLSMLLAAPERAAAPDSPVPATPSPAPADAAGPQPRDSRSAP